LTFGFDTTCEATSEAELVDWVPCRVYLMEGGVRFDLRVVDAPDHVILELRPKGKPRDTYLPSHVRWSLSCVGIPKEQMHDVDDG
jgi:hypothetical protein